MLIAQIIAGAITGIIIAIAGAYVSHFLTTRRDREHWSREDQLRNYDRRRQVYSDLLYWSDTATVIGKVLDDPGSAREMLTDEFVKAHSEVQLLAPHEVVEASDKLSEAFFHFMPDDPDINATEEKVEFHLRPEPHNQLTGAREKFRLVARENLNIAKLAE